MYVQDGGKMYGGMGNKLITYAMYYNTRFPSLKKLKFITYKLQKHADTTVYIIPCLHNANLTIQ